MYYYGLGYAYAPAYYGYGCGARYWWQIFFPKQLFMQIRLNGQF